MSRRARQRMARNDRATLWYAVAAATVAVVWLAWVFPASTPGAATDRPGAPRLADAGHDRGSDRGHQPAASR